MKENCTIMKEEQNGIKRQHNEMVKEMGRKRKNCKKVKMQMHLTLQKIGAEMWTTNPRGCKGYLEKVSIKKKWGSLMIEWKSGNIFFKQFKIANLFCLQITWARISGRVRMICLISLMSGVSAGKTWRLVMTWWLELESSRAPCTYLSDVWAGITQ